MALIYNMLFPCISTFETPPGLPLALPAGTCHGAYPFCPEPQSVRYVKEDINNDQATVSTEIGNERDAPATVEYRLLHKEGDWKVYDIVIEGVSLVNNYRTQFNTIITKDSYAGLVKQMRLKRNQENAGSGQKG